MNFILICTEGENSEPESIKQISIALFGNASGNHYTEVIPIPLGGNQGHNKITRAANKAVKEHEINELIGDNDKIKKYLVCDYDKIERSGLTIETLRQEAARNGFILIINKPNFEFFVLSLLIPNDQAIKIKPNKLIDEINSQIDRINSTTTQESMKIPKYGKHERQAQNCLYKILNLNPSILYEIAKQTPDSNASSYSEMPTLINDLIEISKR